MCDLACSLHLALKRLNYLLAANFSLRLIHCLDAAQCLLHDLSQLIQFVGCSAAEGSPCSICDKI
jgi:hypothetical protein